MSVSAKTDYALRALLEMSSRTDGKPVSAEELGRLQDIPHGFLQAILADLRKAGVVIAQRGQSGGWRMNRDPEDVCVADVIRAVDGPLVSVYGVRPESVSYNDKAEVLQLVWIAARSSLRDVFENVSLADLATGQPPRGRHLAHRRRRRLAAALTVPEGEALARCEARAGRPALAWAAAAPAAGSHAGLRWAAERWVRRRRRPATERWDYLDDAGTDHGRR